MTALLASVSDPSDLLNISDASTPYRFNRIFSAQGFGARRLERKRLALMKELDGTLEHLLMEDEQVEFISWGVEYSFVEHYFMGIWAQLLNRRALIFTDTRLLLVQINSRHKVLELKSQVQYSAMDKFSKGTLGYIGVVLRDKQKLTITGIPRQDRKAIKELISNKLEATRADAPSAGRENLCPHCGATVMQFPDRCSRCTQNFKSPEKAGWLSLAFPGLGDWYLGHRLLGSMEMLGASLAWVFVALVLIPSGTSQGEGPAFVEAGIMAVLIFVFVHCTDFWITRRVARKGIYPA